MKASDLTKLAEGIKRNATDVAVKEEHQPILFLYTGGLENLAIVQLVVVGGPYLREGVQTVLAEMQPDAYLLIAEGRMKRLVALEDIGLDQRGEIANNPGYPECLIMVGCDRRLGERVAWLSEIKGELPNREVAAWRDMLGEDKSVSGALLVESW